MLIMIRKPKKLPPPHFNADKISPKDLVNIPRLEKEKPLSAYEKRPPDYAWWKGPDRDHFWECMTVWQYYFEKEWDLYPKPIPINQVAFPPAVMCYSWNNKESEDPIQRNRDKNLILAESYLNVIESKNTWWEHTIEKELLNQMSPLEKAICRMKDYIIYKWVWTWEKLLVFLCCIYNCSLNNLKSEIKRYHKNWITVELQDWSKILCDKASTLLQEYWIKTRHTVQDYMKESVSNRYISSKNILILSLGNSSTNHKYAQDPEQLKFFEHMRPKNHEQTVHYLNIVRLHNKDIEENKKWYNSDADRQRMLDIMETRLWPWYWEHIDKFEFTFDYAPPESLLNEWEAWKEKTNWYKRIIQSILWQKEKSPKYRWEQLQKHVPWTVAVWLKVKEYLKEEYPKWLKIPKFSHNEWEDPYHTFYPWIPIWLMWSWRETEKTQDTLHNAWWCEYDNTESLNFKIFTFLKQNDLFKKLNINPDIYFQRRYTHTHWWMMSTLTQVKPQESHIQAIKRLQQIEKKYENFEKGTRRISYLMAIFLMYTFWKDPVFAKNFFFVVWDLAEEIQATFDHDAASERLRHDMDITLLRKIYASHGIEFYPDRLNEYEPIVVDHFNYQEIFNWIKLFINEEYRILLNWRYTRLTDHQIDRLTSRFIQEAHFIEDEKKRILHNEESVLIKRFITSNTYNESDLNMFRTYLEKYAADFKQEFGTSIFVK